jgi:hypothetical protein
MSALSLATIPSNINTYERLLVWAAQACQSISNGQQVNVVENGGQQPQVMVTVGKTADNFDRFIIVCYMPCDYPALNSGTQKTWMAAQDVATAAPHSNLLSN